MKSSLGKVFAQLQCPGTGGWAFLVLCSTLQTNDLVLARLLHAVLQSIQPGRPGMVFQHRVSCCCIRWSSLSTIYWMSTMASSAGQLIPCAGQKVLLTLCGVTPAICSLLLLIECSLSHSRLYSLIQFNIYLPTCCPNSILFLPFSVPHLNGHSQNALFLWISFSYCLCICISLFFVCFFFFFHSSSD